jgi:hypothetical protein
MPALSQALIGLLSHTSTVNGNHVCTHAENREHQIMIELEALAVLDQRPATLVAVGQR